MKVINISKTKREKIYNWFKSFSNSTYGVDVEMDVTKLVNFSKENNLSFFANMLYIVSVAINSIEEFRMRLVDDQPVLFDVVHPTYTVMTDSGVFENARQNHNPNYAEFYKDCREIIDKIKKENQLQEVEFNFKDKWDEIYITCTPWLNFTGMTHPIPDSKQSQCVPRICWGKFEEKGDKFKMPLNITVSHIFIDGYHLSKVFNKIQQMLDDAPNILK